MMLILFIPDLYNGAVVVLWLGHWLCYQFLHAYFVFLGGIMSTGVSGWLILLGTIRYLNERMNTTLELGS
jgi:hypothetical protein